MGSGGLVTFESSDLIEAEFHGVGAVIRAIDDAEPW
jgi:hypothetical protein